MNKRPRHKQHDVMRTRPIHYAISLCLKSSIVLFCFWCTYIHRSPHSKASIVFFFLIWKIPDIPDYLQTRIPWEILGPGGGVPRARALGWTRRVQKRKKKRVGKGGPVSCLGARVGMLTVSLFSFFILNWVFCCCVLLDGELNRMEVS